MLIRSRAPLRLGLAGGGTDVSPYSDNHGGAILNATLSLFALATLEPTNDGKIHLISADGEEEQILDSSKELPPDEKFILAKGVYNRISKITDQENLSFRLTTQVDVPQGSGLGTSSTLTVAILGAFVEWLRLPMGEYDIARLAYEIERIDLNMSGGKQDQYSATFGGFNFMEFYGNDKVIVNPLRIRRSIQFELEQNLLLFYTGSSRVSSKIIDDQRRSFKDTSSKALEAAHLVKEQSFMMKEALLTGNLDQMGYILDYGWQHKKDMASGITNEEIDHLYEVARKAGATGGKISGAGGGGFMTLYCPENYTFRVRRAIEKEGGVFYRFIFTPGGLHTWRIS